MMILNKWQEKIEIAQYTNLIDFLQNQGINVKKEGSSYFVKGIGHDSLTILPDKPHMFKHFATGERGNAIVFCKKYLNMSMKEAVDSLVNEVDIKNYKPPIKKENIKEREPFIAPEKADNYKWLFYFLVKERKIAPEIVKHFVDAKILYQTKENLPNGKTFSNIAFLVKNEKGEPVGAIKRGLREKGFKGNHKNSNTSDFGFMYKGTEDKVLRVFEAPIDMMSYMSMMKNGSYQKESFLALGTSYTNALKNYLKNNKVETIALCLDNDGPGLEGTKRLLEDIKSLNFKGKILIHTPKYKDWNDDLRGGVKSENLKVNKQKQEEVYYGR